MGRKSDKTEVASTVKTAFDYENKKQSEETTSREEAKKFIISLFESPDYSITTVFTSAADESKPAAKVSLPSMLRKAKI